MLPSYALRGVAVDTTTGRIRFVNGSVAATDPGKYVCPVLTAHPLYGSNVISAQPCSPPAPAPAPAAPVSLTSARLAASPVSEAGDDWRFNQTDGSVRNRGMCMAYYTTAAPAGSPPTLNEMVLRAVQCSAAHVLSPPRRDRRKAPASASSL